MSLVGIFTRSRPNIEGIFFDAVLSESDEMITEVTEFPIENGTVGNDHALQRPMMITMRVGISDNPFRALREAASSGVDSDIVANAISSGTGIGASLGAGAIAGALGSNAALGGLAAGAINAAYLAGQDVTRSENALEAVRTIQRQSLIIDIVTSKKEYKGCIITRTFRETTKENEQGLELVVELQQMLFLDSNVEAARVPAPNDTADTQGRPTDNLGIVNPREVA